MDLRAIAAGKKWGDFSRQNSRCCECNVEFGRGLRGGGKNHLFRQSDGLFSIIHLGFFLFRTVTVSAMCFFLLHFPLAIS